MSFDKTTVEQVREFGEACRRAVAADGVVVFVMRASTPENEGLTLQVPVCRQGVDAKQLNAQMIDGMLYALEEVFDGSARLLIQSRNGITVTAKQWLQSRIEGTEVGQFSKG